jgi:hypothetical protein
LRISHHRRLGLAIVVILAASGPGGCSTAVPAAGPSPGTTDVAASASSTRALTPTPPPPAASDVTNFCALALQIGHESGIMVGTHYVSPLKETVDQFKALVNLSLAARDRLIVGLPDDVRAALIIELQYFQALKDNHFSSTVPPPPGFEAANKTLNDYQVSVCGFTFDK